MFGFDGALVHLKNGAKVARAGWNGKGMFVWLNKGSIDITNAKPSTIGGVPTYLFEFGDMNTTTRMPNLNMRAADGSTVTGWLISQTDALAEDWAVVE